MLKIYGPARSRAFRVMWMAKELGIAYEQVPVSIIGENPECKQDWFRAINPNCRVPAIDLDGFVMWETAAINLHLARRAHSPLYPKTLEGEGRLLQWAFFVASDIEPPVTTLLRQRILPAAEKPGDAAVAEADARLRKALAILQLQLSSAPYFAEAEWGLADFMVASVLQILQTLKYDLAKFPKVEAWLSASLSRPAALEANKMRA
jgi:glutathione S-transferase